MTKRAALSEYERARRMGLSIDEMLVHMVALRVAQANDKIKARRAAAKRRRKRSRRS